METEPQQSHSLRDLTPRQAEVLGAICDYWERTLRPPTMRELGVHLGGISTSAVSDHLAILERKDWIARDHKHQARSMVVVGLTLDLTPTRALIASHTPGAA